jgi:AcrR family transcriptional regulator
MATAAPTRRGRVPAATREDVIDAAMRRYKAGQRIDVQAVAAELGLGRTTIYRWFGSREHLISNVLVRAAAPRIVQAAAEAQGEGAERLLDLFDRYSRSLASSRELSTFMEQEREAALRIITASKGLVHSSSVAVSKELIEEEVRAGTYKPAIAPATLAYVMIRLGEAFLFSDEQGLRGDVDRLREVMGVLLGVAPSVSSS